MSTLLIVSLILIFLGGVGAILLAIDQFKGTEILKGKITESQDSIIEKLRLENGNLKDIVEARNKEVQDKQDRISELTDSILSFSEQINDVTTNTNNISNIIKNEQKEKGTFEIKVKEYNQYAINFGSGMISSVISKTSKKPTITSINGTQTKLEIKDDKLYFSIQIRDQFNRIVIDVRDNQWAIKKSQIFSVNHDERGVELINSEGEVCFQLDIKDNKINILGFNFEREGVTFFVKRAITNIRYNDPDFANKFNQYYGTIERIFYHQGNDYLGKRLN